jgi:HEAT repeat protein
MSKKSIEGKVTDMAFSDALKDKIMKLGSKQKLDALLKYVNNPNEDVRMTVAMALGMIPTYDSGMALINLLRDTSPMVRAAAAEAAAQIHAKNCEEYVKKLAFQDDDPGVKAIARKAFDKLRDSVLLSA